MFNKSQILYGGGGGGGGGVTEQVFSNNPEKPIFTDFSDFEGVFKIDTKSTSLVTKISGKDLKTTSTQAGDKVIFFVPYNFDLSLDENRMAALNLDNLSMTEISNVRKSVSKGELLLGYQVDQQGNALTAKDFYAKTYSVFDRNANNIYVNFKLIALQKNNTENGNIEDHTVPIFIEVKPYYSNNIKNASAPTESKEIRLTGRVNSPYVKEYKIHVGSSPVRSDQDFLGWSVKVYKSHPEPLTTFSKETVYVNDVTYETDYSLNYPNCALVRQRFSAEYFSDIPSRFYDALLSKIQVPNIYDPITRSYNVNPLTGSKEFNPDGSPKVLPWDGRFKTERVWSDNPAWCFYDLLVSSRYGTGKFIDKEFVDKWTLFEIGKYCDQLVPTGDGGLENRFSCNIMISSREDAFKVLNDMASVFRGLVYYGNSSIISVQDSKKEPLYSFNNANVAEGNFIYSNSSKKVRRTIALVRYNDKKNFYRPAVEYVEDVDGIRKHGYKEIDVTAFGCTSVSQAQRLGKWILFTENLETETASFKTGLEGSLIKPGDIITIIDSNRGNSRAGGRLNKLDVASRIWTFLLDGALGLHPTKKYKLIINLPKFNYDPSLGITDLNSDDHPYIRNSHVLSFNIQKSNTSEVEGKTQISVSSSLSIDSTLHSNLVKVPHNLTWSIFSDTKNDVWNSDSDEFFVPEEQFRVLDVKPNTELTYDISALEYRPEKFNLIDS